jgi:hypothetical protein
MAQPSPGTAHRGPHAARRSSQQRGGRVRVEAKNSNKYERGPVARGQRSHLPLDVGPLLDHVQLRAPGQALRLASGAPLPGLRLAEPAAGGPARGPGGRSICWAARAPAANRPTARVPAGRSRAFQTLARFETHMAYGQPTLAAEG